MENDLKIFNNLLNGLNETGGEPEGGQLNVNFRKKIDGLSDDDIKYENKIFANSPMMKEIRYYVDNFYSAYAMLYYDKKKDGIGVLDENTLKVRLDSLTKKVKLRKTLGLNNFSCSASKG
jgi:hypothetical protein